MRKTLKIIIFNIVTTLAFGTNVYAADETNTEAGCESLLGTATKKDLETIFKYMKIIGPILVILYTGYDYLLALTNKDADEYKKVNKKLINRLILVAILYFLPILLNILLGFIDKKYTTCIS